MTMKTEYFQENKVVYVHCGDYTWVNNLGQFFWPIFQVYLGWRVLYIWDKFANYGT